MHHGSIYKLTKEAAVYKRLRSTPGVWVDSWRLTLETQTTAISTRISGIKEQLPDNEVVEKKQEGTKFYYRWRKIRKTDEQIPLI